MTNQRSNPETPRLYGRLAALLVTLWLAGMGFGANLVMLWDRTGNPPPIAAFWMLLSVVVTVAAAIGAVRAFREAMLSTPVTLSEDEVPDIV